MLRETILNIVKHLPPIEYIESAFTKHPLELQSTQNVYDITGKFAANTPLDHHLMNDIFAVCDGIKDYLWEIINTGHYSKVDKSIRQLYGLAALQKVTMLLIRAENDCGEQPLDELLDKCIWELDNGILVGYPLDHADYHYYLNDCLNIIQEITKSTDATHSVIQQIVIEDAGNPEKSKKCDIDICDRPSIEHFKTKYFNQRPVILRNCMDQWPALSKWNQTNYLQDMCKSRIVPIEIGQNYTNENWSQQLVKFDEFFRRQLIDGEAPTKSIEYLAQHNLFEQIPTLKNDIITPEYCCVSIDAMHTDDNRCDDVDVKAWLGPEGTISPMHFDNKQNLLCQVFGSKRIILAAPSDTHNLYPHDGEMLFNTSQIDAEHLDVQRFPLVSNVQFYELTLCRGEILYIPLKWWHYVRSLSKSFSVSFWWE